MPLPLPCRKNHRCCKYFCQSLLSPLVSLTKFCTDPVFLGHWHLQTSNNKLKHNTLIMRLYLNQQQQLLRRKQTPGHRALLTTRERRPRCCELHHTPCSLLPYTQQLTQQSQITPSAGVNKHVAAGGSCSTASSARVKVRVAQVTTSAPTTATDLNSATTITSPAPGTEAEVFNWTKVCVVALTACALVAVAGYVSSSCSSKCIWPGWPVFD